MAIKKRLDEPFAGARAAPAGISTGADLNAFAGTRSAGTAKGVSKKEAFVGARAAQAKAQAAAEKAKAKIPQKALAAPGTQFGLPAGRNVYETMKIAINPFSRETISVTTDNRIFNTAAEYVANSPYMAAAILTGGAGLIRGAIRGAAKAGAPGAEAFAAEAKKFAVGSQVQAALTKAAPAFRVNTKTAALTGSLLAKVVAQMKKPAFVLSAVAAMIGTYPWAEWANLDNAKLSANMAVRESINTGDPDLMREAIAKRDEIFDMTLWENIQRLIPGANIAFAFGKATEAAFLQKKVSDRVLKDEIVAIETGETDDAKWERVRQEQADQEKAAVDYYNEERKKLHQWEEAARDRDMKEDARFWAKQAEMQRELEKKDREAIAAFWIAYRKTVQKISDDSRPSQLNFGLL